MTIRMLPVLAVLGLLTGAGVFFALVLVPDPANPGPPGQPAADPPAPPDPLPVSEPLAREARADPGPASTRARGRPGDPASSRRGPRRRTVLLAGWVGARTPESRLQAMEGRLEPPPLKPVERYRPLEREIRVTGARPVRMEVRGGPPWGLEAFLPAAGDPVSFLLRDPFRGRGPRLLRFVLDASSSRGVERFLEEDAGPATVLIGSPGVLTGRIVNPFGKPLPGFATADGVKAQADFNGDFTLRVRAGWAVVRAFAIGHAAERRVLRCPGGPYPIGLAPGADLELRIDGVPKGQAADSPTWACAVPAGGATTRYSFAAETFYHRESMGGRIDFHHLPRGFTGTIAIWHRDCAARFLPVTSLTSRVESVTLMPRACLAGSVIDEETRQPIREGVRVTTSADQTTLYDLAVARKLALPPNAGWRQPVPFLGRKLIRIEMEPASGMAFEIRADPALRRLGIKVEADGYLPEVRARVRLGGVQNLEFRLRKRRPLRSAAVVLELPPAPPGGFGRIEIEGPVKDRGRVFAGRGEVRFTGLIPGLYWFKLDGAGDVKPLQVEIKAGENRRLRFPD